MYLERLALTDFRSYAHAEVELEPGPCAFVGLNGQGKTNLVEAVGYLATLGSHRVAADAPLVRAGAERAVIRAGLVREERRAQVEIEITPGKANRARVNGSALPRPRELLGMLRTVLFAPEDLAIVKGDPAERRRFLDELLAAAAPRMAGVRADYERVLRQRNALLKSAGSAVRAGRGDVGTLDVWDEHLAAAGAQLLAARLRLCADLDPLVQKAYEDVAPGGGPATLAYRSSLPEAEVPCPTDPPVEAGLREALIAGLRASRSADLERGVTLVGPHRDDLVLALGDLPARGYASHGETWSFALALRLAAFAHLRAGGPADLGPVLILDDVFAELDTERRARLASLVVGADQVLVTAAVPADVPAELTGARYDVTAGAVRRAG